jgi:hypothetical protein
LGTRLFFRPRPSSSSRPRPARDEDEIKIWKRRETKTRERKKFGGMIDEEEDEVDEKFPTLSKPIIVIDKLREEKTILLCLGKIKYLILTFIRF